MVPALLLRPTRRACIVFVGLDGVVAAVFLCADPRAGWTWLVVAAVALPGLLFWGLVPFRSHVFAAGPRRERKGGTDHG